MNAKRKAALACELEDAQATDSAIDCASFAEVWEEMERLSDYLKSARDRLAAQEHLMEQDSDTYRGALDAQLARQEVVELALADCRERADRAERELSFAILEHEAAHQVAAKCRREYDAQTIVWTSDHNALVEKVSALRRALVSRMHLDENDAFPRPISRQLFGLYSVLETVPEGGIE